MITQEELKKAVSYDPETGIWTRLVKRGKALAGTNPCRILIGTNGRSDPYWILSLGKTYMSARLAHFYMTGEWPKGQMFHINRKTLDDRWENLLHVTKYELEANKRPNRNNRFGVRGCWFDQRGKKYVSQIQRRWRRRRLGTFSTLEEAVAAYEAADRNMPT